MRAIAVLCALLAASANAFWGSFEPRLYRNAVTITIIDTQFANVECAKRVHPLLAPLAVATAGGCFDFADDALIVPVTIGPGSLMALQGGVTPNQLLGHEFSHAFRGQFHPAILSFIELDWLRKPGKD